MVLMFKPAAPAAAAATAAAAMTNNSDDGFGLNMTVQSSPKTADALAVEDGALLDRGLLN